MISLSAGASRGLADFYAANPDAPKTIRLFIAPGACSGPSLNMALDQVDEGDRVEEHDGVTFCMVSALVERVGHVKIDFDGVNFKLTCERPVVDPSAFGCSCCSGDCGSGSCSC